MTISAENPGVVEVVIGGTTYATRALPFAGLRNAMPLISKLNKMRAPEAVEAGSEVEDPTDSITRFYERIELMLQILCLGFNRYPSNPNYAQLTSEILGEFMSEEEITGVMAGFAELLTVSGLNKGEVKALPTA